MADYSTSSPQNPAQKKPKIRAVTPTYNRSHFLINQYDQFDAMSRAYNGEAEWVIIDKSAEPNTYFSDLEDNRVVYIHLPTLDRRHLVEHLEELYPELAACVLPDAEAVQSKVGYLKALKEQAPEKYPPMIKEPENWNELSLGEQRNMSLALRTDGPRADLVVSLDDDDFYGPEYLNWVEGQLQNHDFIRQGDLFMYIQDCKGWVLYEFDSNSSTHKIKSTGELIETILPEEVRRRQAEGTFSREGFGFGLGFAYRMNIIDDIIAEGETVFPPISLYEDGFMLAGLEDRGADIHFPKSANPLVCRIMHSRMVGPDQQNISATTRMHTRFDKNQIRSLYPDMHEGVMSLVKHTNNSNPVNDHAAATQRSLDGRTHA